MQLLYRSLLAICCVLATCLSAQTQLATRSADIPTLSLPALNNAQLLETELQARKPGRAPVFAEVREVSVRPNTHGSWADNGDGTSTWKLLVESPTAFSLNLGFTEYWMPAGGELYLTTGDKENWQVQGPFTPADNEVHNQLWTPIVKGDQLVIQVNLPTAERSNLRLWLTHVNHDFLNFTSKSVSGSCNLDVVCAAEDGWEIVDLYRDIIRSVAVISTGGGTFCTGYLVNNVRQDGTPYFMTANHCGIGAGNAPSLVTYWNFDNSTCRQPGSGASGAGGDGMLNVFNSGATWLASWPASDMTIVEMDDPIVEEANAFFAGWDNTYDVPTDTVIGIHHPSTDEKRISFTFQQTFFTNGFNGPADPTGTHLEVPDWDIGTTEPGSSGSPLFNRAHRVVGQLHGGAAACGNNAYDTYGAFARSWTGGGGSSTRLSDWLDPDGTGATVLDGQDANEPQAVISATPTDQSICNTESSVYTVSVGGGFTGPVQLQIEDLPAGLTASYSQNPVMPGSAVQLTITPNAGLSGSFSFNLLAENGADSDQSALGLTVVNGTPSFTALVEPANNAFDVELSPLLTWNETPGFTYEYQVASDGNMSFITASGTTDGSFAQLMVLDEGTQYHWRVRASNDCGTGPWTTIRNFTTLSLLCSGAEQSVDVPINIDDDNANNPTFSFLTTAETETISGLEVNVEITHTYVGDIAIDLISPDGVSVTLLDRVGFPATNFGCSGDNLNLTFSDFAVDDYQTLETVCGAGAFAAEGTYQPAEPLGTFNGESPLGEWTLSITDNAGQDVGTLDSWSITFCSQSGTLPVVLDQFKGASVDCDVDLEWSASQEDNFSHYVLEASKDGRRFAAVTEIAPNARGAYQHRVSNAAGTNYYRLQLVDRDGTSSYSEVITTSNDCGKMAIRSLFPNPTSAGGTLTVQFDRPLAGDMMLRVYSADGRQLSEQAIGAGSTNPQVDIRTLPAGTYFLRVVTEGEVLTESFVVGK